MKKKPVDRSKIGRSSRQKGKAFERRCRSVIAKISRHPHWRRTEAGHEQHKGDLIACDATGRVTQEVWDKDCSKWYVECKTRGVICLSELKNWIALCQEKAPADDWVLLFKQTRGPVFAMFGVNVEIVENELGPFFVIE